MSSPASKANVAKVCRRSVIDSPLWQFLEIQTDADAEQFRVRVGELDPRKGSWADWQTAIRHIRGVWNLYYWVGQVERGELREGELRRRLIQFLQDSRRARRPYPEGTGYEFLMRVTQDLANFVGEGIGPLEVRAIAPGRIALRRAPQTLLHRMYGDLFSAMATRMDAAECSAPGCSVVYLRNDPRQRYCGSTCKNREAQRARRGRVPTL